MEIKNYEIDIRKLLVPALKSVKGIKVFAGINSGDPYYPAVIVTQTDSSMVSQTYDSAGWHHVRYAYDINVYTKGDDIVKARQLAASIANTVSETMQGIGFQMDSCVPNLGDKTLKTDRIAMRFTAIIDTTTDTTFRG